MAKQFKVVTSRLVTENRTYIVSAETEEEAQEATFCTDPEELSYRHEDEYEKTISISELKEVKSHDL